MAASAPSGLSSHPLWHLVAVAAAPAAIIAAFKVYDRIRHAPSTRSQRTSRTGSGGPGGRRLLLALGSGGAGVIHAGVCPEHFREGLVLGVFFVFLAAGQLGWAWAIVARPSRVLLSLAVVASATVILVWLWTRTVGVPFASGGAGPESPGLLDVVATVLELLVAIGAAVELRTTADLSGGLA